MLSVEMGWYVSEHIDVFRLFKDYAREAFVAIQFSVPSGASVDEAAAPVFVLGSQVGP